jgi:hypothetical protein
MRTAIVSVAFNRVESLIRQLQSLTDAIYDSSDVTLIISIDKSDSTSVEDFARSFNWTHGSKRVITHDHNLGTRHHIMSLGSLFADYDALIVLEDDIIVAPSFWLYAQACLSRYANDDRVAGISLYSFSVNYQNNLPFRPLRSSADVYLMNCAQSWGEVWTRRQWTEFKTWYDRQGSRLSSNAIPSCLRQWPDTSWLKFHTCYCIEKNKYFVYPYDSLSTNNADAGVNSRRADTLMQAPLLAGMKRNWTFPEHGSEICYDGFFEPKFLAKYLNIANAEFVCDLYGEKAFTPQSCYLLSLKPLGFKVVNSFSLKLRPIEMNIILNSCGSAIRLYDTSQPAAKPKAADTYSLYHYYYGNAFYKSRTMLGFGRCMRLWCELIVNKIKNIIQK